MQSIHVCTLGFPVLPLVYMMMAISSGPGGTEIDVTGPFQYRDRRHGTFSYRDRRHGTLPIQRQTSQDLTNTEIDVTGLFQYRDKRHRTLPIQR